MLEMVVTRVEAVEPREKLNPPPMNAELKEVA